MNDLRNYLEYLFRESFMKTSEAILKTKQGIIDWDKFKDKQIRKEFMEGNKDKKIPGLKERILLKKEDIFNLLIKEFGKNQDALRRYNLFLEFITDKLPNALEKYDRHFTATRYDETVDAHISELLKK